MQLVGVILLLISVGTVVGPVGAVAYTYRDNLAQMVVPTQLNEIVNGTNSAFLTPVFVGSQVNVLARTFSVTVNFTNTLGYDLTINSVSAQAVCTEHNYSLGTIGLASPAMALANETTTITVSGSWTQDAENHILSQHLGATSVDVNLIELTIDVNGVTVQQNEPVSVGNIPIT